jgi:hypothetical protein
MKEFYDSCAASAGYYSPSSANTNNDNNNNNATTQEETKVDEPKTKKRKLGVLGSSSAQNKFPLKIVWPTVDFVVGTTST